MSSEKGFSQTMGDYLSFVDSAGGTTPLFIPERITDLNRMIAICRIYGFKGSITEVVISNKTRKSWCWIKVWIYAGTLPL